MDKQGLRRSQIGWRARLYWLVAAILLASFWQSAMAASTADSIACQTGHVQAPAGSFCGLQRSVDGREAQAFLGIPFAQTTAGMNRLAPPLAKEPLPQFAATRYGTICPQPQLPGSPLPTMGEDCLNLNLWRPATAKADARLPVMVFIYGGAFTLGDNTYGLYDGAYLAAHEDVIVVNLNYRLGALGFFVNQDVSGNLGILDQQMALRWVQSNIAAFGGDPSKVTLFGESAGAMSVGLHTFSIPSSKPLFRAAIMESNVLGVPFKTVEQQAHVTDMFMTLLGCEDTACVRSKSVQEILDAQDAIFGSLKKVFNSLTFFVPFGPVIDQQLIMAQPMQAARGYDDKPILLGSNLTDAKLFVGDKPISNVDMIVFAARAFGLDYQRVLQTYPIENATANVQTWTMVQTQYLMTCAAKEMASRVRSPAYLYRFDHTPSFPVWGGPMCDKPGTVCHGAELPFVFHTAGMIGGRFTKQESTLAQAMVDYWTNFAKYLNPNGPVDVAGGLVTWPATKPGAESFLSLRLPTPVSQSSATEPCALWRSIGYDLVEPWVSRSSHGK